MKLPVASYRLQVFRMSVFNVSSRLLPQASFLRLSAFCSLQDTDYRLQILRSAARQQLGRKGKYGISGTIRGSGSVAGSAAVAANRLFSFKTTDILPGRGAQRTDSPGCGLDHVQHRRRIRTRQQKGVHPFFNHGQGIERRSSFSTLRRFRSGISQRSGIQFHAQLGRTALPKIVVLHPLSGKLPGQRAVASAGNGTIIRPVGCRVPRVMCHVSRIRRQVKRERSTNGKPATCNLQPVTVEA